MIESQLALHILSISFLSLKNDLARAAQLQTFESLSIAKRTFPSGALINCDKLGRALESNGCTTLVPIVQDTRLGSSRENLNWCRTRIKDLRICDHNDWDSDFQNFRLIESNKRRHYWASSQPTLINQQVMSMTQFDFIPLDSPYLIFISTFPARHCSRQKKKRRAFAVLIFALSVSHSNLVRLIKLKLSAF